MSQIVTLARNLINVARTFLPMDFTDRAAQIVEAAGNLVSTFEDAKDLFDGRLEDATSAELEDVIGQLRAKVNAHADRTIESLG